MRHLGAILAKEWAETIRNRLLLATVFVLPAVFVLLPLGILFFMGQTPVDPDEIRSYVERVPALAALSASEVLQIMVINQFLFFFLLMPSIIPMTVAAYSIIGEKQARSLEPLLATPVSTAELLLGKAIAAVVPAVVLTWISYLVFAIGAGLIATPAVLRSIVDPMWLLAMIVIGPLVGVFSVFLGVIISSRVNDTRIAQQLGGMIALPVAGIAVAQTAGFVLLSATSFAVGALALLALDAVVFGLGVRLFQRDRILTEWK
jgi:ABC-2 type transport system permease protein